MSRGIASYPIEVVTTSEHAAVARKFVDYVFSPAGQEILASFGFSPVNGATG